MSAVGPSGTDDGRRLRVAGLWGVLVSSPAIAFVLTVPVNRWLIACGRGHAVVHEYHH